MNNGRGTGGPVHNDRWLSAQTPQRTAYKAISQLQNPILRKIKKRQLHNELVTTKLGQNSSDDRCTISTGLVKTRLGQTNSDDRCERSTFDSSKRSWAKTVRTKYETKDTSWKRPRQDTRKLSSPRRDTGSLLPNMVAVIFLWETDQKWEARRLYEGKRSTDYSITLHHHECFFLNLHLFSLHIRDALIRLDNRINKA